MKKKVVHIAQSSVGGVPEYLYTLLNNIDTQKYDNILILSEEYKNQIEKFNKVSSKIYFVPMVREISFKNDVSAIMKVNKIIHNVKPDIVYLHSSKAGAIGRIAMLFNRKIKVIYNAHGWYFNAEISEKKRKVISLIEKILATKTNMIINISKDEYNSAIERKIAKPNKMCIIENGIDFRKFENIDKYRKTTREKYNIKDDEIVIGVVGRIEEQKDPITFIKAAKIVNEKVPNTKFMYIGAGSLENDVKLFAKENNLENNVIITGWTNNVERYIPALDIAVLPSKWEGFGLAIIEYMACKKPIIASKVGGIEDIINDEKKGFLITPQDYNTLSKYIIKYIEDKELVNKIIDFNYKYAIDKYNIKSEIEKTEKIFDM